MFARDRRDGPERIFDAFLLDKPPDCEDLDRLAAAVDALPENVGR